MISHPGGFALSTQVFWLFSSGAQIWIVQVCPARWREAGCV
jgi:hypothetical protein